MQNGSRNTFLNFLILNFKDKIDEYVGGWLKDHLDKLGYKAIDKSRIKLNSSEFITVRMADKCGDEIRCDLVLVVSFHALVLNPYNHFDIIETNFDNKWLKLTFEATLENDSLTIRISSLEPYKKPKRAKHNPVDGDLLPKLMDVKDYEKFALDYIRKNVDKNYDGSYAIPILDLAKKCGLEVWDYKFAGKRRPYGRLFLVDSEFECFDMDTNELITTEIRANSICVDVTANKQDSSNKANVTIAHELSHFILHKKAFLFQRLVQDDLVEFADYYHQLMDAKGFDKDIIEKMEIQATIMGPILLMPRKALIDYTKSIYHNHIVVGKDDILIYIESIIRNVAHHFGVTIYAARKRMKECGFFQKADAFVFIDEGYIKPFAYAKGSLAYDETFLLSTKQLERIYNNEKLRKHLKNSKYLFVDNHLVFNAPKYIKRDSNGVLVMTDFALHHADKCCLKFKLVNENNGCMNSFIDDSLYRDANKLLSYNLTIAKNDDVCSKYNENTHKRYLANIREVKSKLEGFNEFQDALKFLIEYQDMSQQELANCSGLSLSTIKRYLRKDEEGTTPGKQATIRLCIGLQLCEELAVLLCNIIGHPLNPKNEDDKTCLMVFQTLSQHSLVTVAKVLHNLGKEHIIKVSQ